MLQSYPITFCYVCVNYFPSYINGMHSEFIQFTKQGMNLINFFTTLSGIFAMEFMTRDGEYSDHDLDDLGGTYRFMPSLSTLRFTGGSFSREIN